MTIPSGKAAAGERRVDLDRAKGLAILLVVVGHLVAREPPADNAWYVVLKAWLYLFHMPFFMYLSGYVTFLSGAAYTTAAKWWKLARRRAERLLLPFLLFGLTIAAGKIIASKFLYVDNLPPSFSQAIIGMLWHTATSPATSVWYIAVLFVLCIVTPPLLWALRGRTLWLVSFAAIIYALPLPPIIYLDRIGAYFLFFALGGLAYENGKGWLDAIDRHMAPAMGIFLAACVLLLSPISADLNQQTKLLIAGSLSIPAVHGFVRSLRRDPGGALLLLGTYSFVIYLLNTIFIGLTKAIMLRLFSWDGPNFLIYVPVLLAAGVLAPILVKRYVFRWFPYVDRLTT